VHAAWGGSCTQRGVARVAGGQARGGAGRGLGGVEHAGAARIPGCDARFGAWKPPPFSRERGGLGRQQLAEGVWDQRRPWPAGHSGRWVPRGALPATEDPTERLRGRWGENGGVAAPLRSGSPRPGWRVGVFLSKLSGVWGLSMHSRRCVFRTGDWIVKFKVEVVVVRLVRVESAVVGNCLASADHRVTAGPPTITVSRHG